MKKEDKNLVIEALGAQLGEYAHFYLVNIEGLNAEKTSELRRACFKEDIKLLVAKNTLLQKALEKKGFDEEIFAALKGRETDIGNGIGQFLVQLRDSVQGSAILDNLHNIPPP